MTTEQTDIVEQVKARNPIEDVVQADNYPLPNQRGRYRKCTTPHLGGLVIDTQLQCYHWNVKAEHGDVINWVMNRQGCDFKTAVDLLADRAGIPRPNWGNQDPAVRLAVRAREDALDVAQRVFESWYRKSPEARAYAEGRGWSTWLGQDDDGDEIPGTIVRARLGYSGAGSDEEREEMRHALLLAGVDLDAPVAVAILGMRGDVAGWARRHELEISDDYLMRGFIPGMLGHKRIVYPHLRFGRVVYMAGRGIDVKFHFNLPRDLVGERQPYFNHVYSPRAEACVVVEGQADAISLAQWDIPAVALAGVAPNKDLADQLCHHSALYVGLDDDQAGQSNSWKVADALGPMTRILSWHSQQHPNFKVGEEWREVKDANDLLRALEQGGEKPEAQKAYIQGLLGKAITYVERLCYWTGIQEGAAKIKALPQALKTVARLDEMQMSIYEKSLAKMLKVSVVEMRNQLKTLAAQEEREKSQGEPIYIWGGVYNGWLIEYLYDSDKKRASLAWRDPQGHVGSGDEVIVEGKRYLPYPVNETVNNGAILFPSAVGDRKSIGELVNYIELYISSIYLMPSDKLTRLVAYWVISTWLYDCFETVIYLRAIGGAGSGKSEMIKRIGMVCYRTMAANGATSPSSLFRAVERYKCTVLLDEADLQQSDTEADMVKFYNLGAMRGGVIWRAVEVQGPNGQKDFEERAFQTFCPKLIGMRKEFRDDAVGTRSLTIKLAPREMPELMAAGIPLTVNTAIRMRAQALRNALLRYRLDNWQPEIEVDAEFYDLTISARLNQVAGPMLAMAKEDPEQQQDIRNTLREYYAETILTQSMSLSARVIEAMWKIYQYPDLHKEHMRQETDGVEMVKIGGVTEITNAIINEMNDDEGDEVEGKKGRELKSQRVGRIIRNELQMQVSSRRRDGFWVYWNEPKMIGLSTKFGIDPEDFKPQGAPKAQEGPKPRL